MNPDDDTKKHFKPSEPTEEDIQDAQPKKFRLKDLNNTKDQSEKGAEKDIEPKEEEEEPKLDSTLEDPGTSNSKKKLFKIIGVTVILGGLFFIATQLIVMPLLNSKEKPKTKGSVTVIRKKNDKKASSHEYSFIKPNEEIAGFFTFFEPEAQPKSKKPLTLASITDRLQPELKELGRTSDNSSNKLFDDLNAGSRNISETQEVLNDLSNEEPNNEAAKKKDLAGQALKNKSNDEQGRKGKENEKEILAKNTPENNEMKNSSETLAKKAEGTSSSAEAAEEIKNKKALEIVVNTEAAPVDNYPSKAEISKMVRKMHVTSIIAKGKHSRLTMDGRLYRMNEIIDDDTNLKWVSIAPEKHVIYFQDERGNRYRKRYY